MTELQQAVEHRLVVAAVARRVMKAREDEGAFMSLVIRQEPEQTPIVMVAHHQLFLDFTDAHPRCVVRMPPGTGKTILAKAVAYQHSGGQLGQRLIHHIRQRTLRVFAAADRAAVRLLPHH